MGLFLLFLNHIDIGQGGYKKTLYDALVDKNVKLDFGMYANPTETSAPASYDPRDRSIKFKDNSSITKDNLKEELFHAWQDAYYPGGIWQYRETGKVNIEFEAKVFKDLIMEMGGFSAFFNYGTPEGQRISDEYQAWIYSVQDDISILQDESAYQYWLDLFNEHNPAYSSPKSDDFSSFHGLYDSISNSNCFNN